MVYNAIFNIILVNLGGQCTYPYFPLYQYSAHYLSKPLSAFTHNHCQSNGQWWEKNESCVIDYHQPLERILAKLGIKPVTSCSQMLYATDWGTGTLQTILEFFGKPKIRW